MKKLYALLTGLTSLILLTATASAHVTVLPSDAQTSTYQAFTVSVPNEKEIPTITVKLTIPDSIKSVTPTVKPGWTISIDKDGTEEDARVTSVTWSGGSIGAGLRDDFGFTAKTPDQAGEIQWKAYQTYSDGTVVSWDKESHGDGHEQEDPNSGPLSVTKVAVEESTDTTETAAGSDTLARSIGVISLVMSLALFALVTKKPAPKK